MEKFTQRYLAPILVPVGAIIVLGAVIVGIGSILVAVFDKANGKDNLARPELWIGIGILVAVIALMTLLSRKEGGILAKDVVLGKTPFWEDAADLPPVDPRVTYGQPGYIEDITAGYTLYALSGKLATVIGVLPGGRDFGKTFSGMLHAEGLGHAAREMWIPVEAVSAVYPESNAAFLAIKGDETEAFGWTLPPESITRGVRHQTAADKVK